jgi:hypothetical protein
VSGVFYRRQLVAVQPGQDELIQISIEDGVQVMDRQPQAMVSDAILRKVVCSDFLASVPASDLRSPGFSGLALHLFSFHFKEFGAKVCHGLVLVLVLGPLVLALDDEIGG